MSIALMSEAWKLKGIGMGRKFVLIALCDNANDDGMCYPSVSNIANRCDMSERAVQGHIETLIETGIVTREIRSGRSSIYHVNPRRICTPAESAPPQNLHPTPAESAPHPRRICTPPPQNLHPTPAESAPITINEPSMNPHITINEPREGEMPQAAGVEKTKKPITASVEIPAWMPAELWGMIAEHRKSVKAPFTQTAQVVILKTLGKISTDETTLRDIVETSIVNGWKGFFPPKQPQPNAYKQPVRPTTTKTEERRYAVVEDL